jgi:Mn2+/Fe2+ NRAMP family transporter
LKTEQQVERFNVAQIIGPGLLVAAAGIGAGDIVSATVGGANYGLALLWAVVLAAFLKCFLNEGIARWQLATNSTAIEGWAAHLPWWVNAYFGVYLVLWTPAVTGALSNACGLGIANLTGGAIPANWGAVLHTAIGFTFVLIGGFEGFEKIMKVLIGIMFFSMIACAILTLHDPLSVLKGFIPAIPAGGGTSVLSVLGGIGGSITMLSYNYWLREEKMAGPRWLKHVRKDIAVAYCFTALFGMSVMSIADQTFHVPAIKITDAQAVTKMAETLGSVIGGIGFYSYSIGFYAAVFASLLGVWQSVPYIYADFYSVVRRYRPEERLKATEVTSRPYRLALLYVAIAPIPLAFTNQALVIIRTYTIVGSLFVPFLAATLLYLNNFRIPANGGVRKNGALTNAVLILALVLFALVGAREAGLLPR